MLAELPDMAGSAEDCPRYEPSDIRGVVLAPGLVHLTYETTINPEVEAARLQAERVLRVAHPGSH
ncbi:hypothetical protein GCM10023083_39720 [Streptomyces phyllanthi]